MKTMYRSHWKLWASALLAVGMLALPAAAQVDPVATAKAVSTAFAQVAEKASPAVVFIEVDAEANTQQMPQGMDPGDLFERFFGPGMPNGPWRQLPQGRGEQQNEQQNEQQSNRLVPYGQGTGFIITPDGYIITNHHLVGDAKRVRVKLSDGREFEAKIIGSDADTEVALVKIEGDALPTLPLGDSDKLLVGEWVVAIGSPFGLSHTVTTGIVSAKGRGNVGIVDYADFIQTDAAINPGNSGGPLVNLDGEVVGVNTAILSRSGGSMGIGFAIPSNMVKYVKDQLIEKGAVTRGFLGIGIQNLTPELAQWFGIQEGNGVLVSEVSPGSPAEKAGIQRDDVVIEYEGVPAKEIGSFRSRVASTAPGTSVKIVLMRGGERMEKTIEIGAKTGSDAEPGTGAEADGASAASQVQLGIRVDNLTDDLAQRLGFEGESGVIVTQVDPTSSAAASGIKQGTLIQEVNRQPVHNTSEFEAAIKNSDGKKSVLLRVKDGEISRYAAIEISK